MFGLHYEILYGNSELEKGWGQKTGSKNKKLHGALHPRADVDRIYLKRKHGERGIIVWRNERPTSRRT